MLSILTFFSQNLIDKKGKEKSSQHKQNERKIKLIKWKIHFINKFCFFFLLSNKYGICASIKENSCIST